MQPLLHSAVVATVRRFEKGAVHFEHAVVDKHRYSAATPYLRFHRSRRQALRQRADRHLQGLNPVCAESREILAQTSTRRRPSELSKPTTGRIDTHCRSIRAPPDADCQQRNETPQSFRIRCATVASPDVNRLPRLLEQPQLRQQRAVTLAGIETASASVSAPSRCVNRGRCRHRLNPWCSNYFGEFARNPRVERCLRCGNRRLS